jgi:osmotically-inducible protein OsmY
MKNNETLQKEVQDAIKWEPLLHAAEIGVTAKDGVITLTGVVDSYTKKIEAETAAKNVAGVKAVVEKIEINFGSLAIKSDNEIASEIVNAIKWNLKIPNNTVKIKVEKGWVTLEGELSWNYQKNTAKNAITEIKGIKGITNRITIKPESRNEIEKQVIESALERNGSINTENVHVTVDGTLVTLSGTVNSLYEKEEVEKITWNAHGVWHVENDLVVEYSYATANYDSSN